MEDAGGVRWWDEQRIAQLLAEYGPTLHVSGNGVQSGAAPVPQASVKGVPELWTPAPDLPHEAFVERLHRAIASFAEETGVEKPLVEVELADRSRFVLERIEPEPGFGMVTLYITDARDEAPDALIVPIGSLRRIELSKSPEERVQSFGFSVPPATQTSQGATSSAITSNQT